MFHELYSVSNQLSTITNYRLPILAPKRSISSGIVRKITMNVRIVYDPRTTIRLLGLVADG